MHPDTANFDSTTHNLPDVDIFVSISRNCPTNCSNKGRLGFLGRWM